MKWTEGRLAVSALTLLEVRSIRLAALSQELLLVYCAIGRKPDCAAHVKFHLHHYRAKPSDQILCFLRAFYRAVCSNKLTSTEAFAFQILNVWRQMREHLAVTEEKLF